MASTTGLRGGALQPVCVPRSPARAALLPPRQGAHQHARQAAHATRQRERQATLEQMQPPPAVPQRAPREIHNDRQQAPAPSTVLPVLLAAFSMIALDVAAPLSLHLLQPLDSTVHAFMQAHVPYDVRLIADKPMSNWPILAGCGASAALAGVVAWRRPVQGLTAAGLWAVMNSLVGGVFLNADAKGTLLLKRAIGRARPSDLHGGFSFPSGHATTAYFVLGWLLFILVPLAAEALQSDNAPTNGDLPPSEAGGLQAGAAQALRRLSSGYVALPLLLLAAGTTQVGRLTADVHWCSDVVAGALLGSAGVAVSALLLQAVLRQKQVES